MVLLLSTSMKSTLLVAIGSVILCSALIPARYGTYDKGINTTFIQIQPIINILPCTLDFNLKLNGLCNGVRIIDYNDLIYGKTVLFNLFQM